MYLTKESSDTPPYIRAYPYVGNTCWCHLHSLPHSLVSTVPETQILPPVVELVQHSFKIKYYNRDHWHDELPALSRLSNHCSASSTLTIKCSGAYMFENSHACSTSHSSTWADKQNTGYYTTVYHPDTYTNGLTSLTRSCTRVETLTYKGMFSNFWPAQKKTSRGSRMEISIMCSSAMR